MTQDASEQRRRRHEARGAAVGARAQRIRAVALHELDVALAALEALPDDARVLQRSRLISLVAKATRLLDSLGTATRAAEPVPIADRFAGMATHGRAPRLSARDRKALG